MKRKQQENKVVLSTTVMKNENNALPAVAFEVKFSYWQSANYQLEKSIINYQLSIFILKV